LVGCRRLVSLTCLAVASALALAGYRTPLAAGGFRSTAGRAGPASAPAAGSGAVRPEIPIDRGAAETGALSLRLPDSTLASNAAVVTPLSAEETAALIARLEPLPDLSASNSCGFGCDATPPDESECD
jgi:hypothetical protein